MTEESSRKFRDNFLEEWAPQLGKRAGSFTKVFTYLLGMRNPPYTIVETGVARNEKENFNGDGASTFLFNEFIKSEGGELYSVDIKPEYVELAQKLYPEANISCKDSVEFLKELAPTKKNIDLLYLDSMDINFNEPYPSAVHHLREFFESMPMIESGTLLVVDDNLNNIGKGMLVRGIMELNGKALYINEYQWGWIC